MSIVSDASIFINLARIRRLDLLHALYNEVLIPEAVWEEVVIQGVGQPGAEEVQAASWVTVHRVNNQPLVRALQRELDAGEAEAIVLALEKNADLLLMDERLGREIAHHLGLRCVGLIGVLLEAKHKGLIQAVKPYLDALRDIAGFWVKEALYLRILQDEREI